MKNVLVLPGDGIGKEVVAPAIEVMQVAAQQQGVTIDVEEALVGGAAIDDCGDPLPESTLARQKPPTRCFSVVWVAPNGTSCQLPSARKKAW